MTKQEIANTFIVRFWEKRCLVVKSDYADVDKVKEQFLTDGFNDDEIIKDISEEIDIGSIAVVSTEEGE